jgi:hypothetical protein
VSYYLYKLFKIKISEKLIRYLAIIFLSASILINFIHYA